MKKEQFQQCLNDILGSYDRRPKDLPNNGAPSADGYYHLRLDPATFSALVIALRWAKQNIEDFEPKTYCVMCGTHVTANENALCDYHIRLKASGLVCVWGYADDDGWEFYCGDQAYKDNLCQHHYDRTQKETPEALYDEAVKALEQMRAEGNS